VPSEPICLIDEPSKRKKCNQSISNTGRHFIAFTGDCTEIAPPKNNSILTISNESRSTGNAPQLECLINFETDEIFHNKYIDEKYHSEMDQGDNDISLPDEIEAFPIVVSELEEVIQTTNSDQPPAEQDASWLTPISILTADTIGALRSQKILKVLFDPGSTYTFIHRRALPWHCQPIKVKDAKKINTINGANSCNEVLQFPEQSKLI
jgi:hypothetical protein